MEQIVTIASPKCEQNTATWLGDAVPIADTRRSVLIVEDEPAIRVLLTMLLEGEDYRVATAEDGQEALAKLLHHKPDAVVLDLGLPTMDGCQFIDALDRDAQSGRIPIIAVSAGRQRVSVGEHGVRAFLSKPFDMDTLLITLDQVLH